MNLIRARIVVLAMVVAGFAVGACAEVGGRLGHQVAPAAESPALTANQIAAIADFGTAAGPIGLGHPAARHVQDLANEVVSALNDGSRTDDQRIAYFRKLLARDLDIALIARFAAGASWRSATEGQRAAYLDAFADFVLQTYAIRLGGIEVTSVQVIEATSVGKGDFLVHSKVVRTEGDPATRADWRLTRRDGRFRILDLSVNGISMALTLRQEFSSVLRRQGGVDGLVALLRQRTA